MKIHGIEKRWQFSQPEFHSAGSSQLDGMQARADPSWWNQIPNSCAICFHAWCGHTTHCHVLCPCRQLTTTMRSSCVTSERKTATAPKFIRFCVAKTFFCAIHTISVYPTLFLFRFVFLLYPTFYVFHTCACAYTYTSTGTYTNTPITMHMRMRLPKGIWTPSNLPILISISISISIFQYYILFLFTYSIALQDCGCSRSTFFWLEF